MTKDTIIDIVHLLSAAEKYWQADQLENSASLYTEVLKREPQHAHANYMMSQIALKIGNFQAAQRFIGIAINQKTNLTHEYYKALGDIHRSQGQLHEAIASYKNAIEIKPDYLEALNNAGTASLIISRVDDAVRFYSQVLQIKPDHALALYNLGFISEETNNFHEAQVFYQRAIDAKPDFAEAYNNLGNIFRKLKYNKEAKQCFKRALEIRSDYIEARFNLATILKDLKEYDGALQEFLLLQKNKNNAEIEVHIGQLLHIKGLHEDAINHYQSALLLDPTSIDALNNLGSIFCTLEKYADAKIVCEKVIDIEPHNSTALNNLGNVYKNQGQTDKAISYYKQSLKYDPHNARQYGNLLLSMLYSPSISPEELFETTREFGNRIADPLLPEIRSTPDKNPDRKLRIGYVSPDFRDHAVNYFFEGLLTLHDRNHFEIFAYSNVQHEDFITYRLKQKFDHWRDIKKVDGSDAARMIAEDHIDILVDLAGHTAKNRLLVFARKPAPIQVSWLGYPATTGMKAMDYRLTDHYAEPEGMTEHLNVEKLWRLPHIFCCYGGHTSNPSVINHPPSQDNGYITFGCFNNFTKVTDDVLRIWAQIIAQVENSRLILEIQGLDHTEYKGDVENRIMNAGIPLERVILINRHKDNQFVLYNKIDIALDPFPCAGGTTSMDTLWMGVPLITIAGKHFVSRMGVTILTNVGLPELIAENTDDYIHKAVDLATNSERLKSIRDNLRGKVLNSPMMNQISFTKDMEDAFRQMWRKYCLTD